MESFFINSNFNLDGISAVISNNISVLIALECRLSYGCLFYCVKVYDVGFLYLTLAGFRVYLNLVVAFG